MKAYILILFTLISAGSMAQNITEPQGYEAKENLRELGSTDGTGSVRTFDNRYEGVRGTPYVFENFQQGEVYFKNKNKLGINELNYNCFENEIAFVDPSTEVVRLFNKFQVDLFTIRDGEKELTFVPLKLEEDGETIFAQVLYNTGSSVFKVYGKEWIKANYEGGYSADRRYDEFVDKYDLFYQIKGEQTMNKAKKSKKQLLASFPDHKDEISSYIKSSKPDLKDEESLVKLMEYYDSL